MPSIDDALDAGLALYAAGEHRAAHDPWEHVWLELADGEDERFLHGLIQLTAGVHHARERNWSGATGLAESALEYLAPLPAEHRGVDVDAARAYLRVLARDPECIERGPPPVLSADGEPVAYEDLSLDAAAEAAVALADEYGYDEDVIEAAAGYARDERGEGRARFAALLFDFLRGGERSVVFDRLDQHVERKRAREEDVDRLFEESEADANDRRE